MKKKRNVLGTWATTMPKLMLLLVVTIPRRGKGRRDGKRKKKKKKSVPTKAKYSACCTGNKRMNNRQKMAGAW